MAIEVQSDSALMIKKRARRRLVGSIALVLMMLIILPQVLQNRQDTSNSEAVTITMVDRQQAEAVSQLTNEVDDNRNEGTQSPEVVANDDLKEQAVTQVEDNVVSDEADNGDMVGDKTVVIQERALAETVHEKPLPQKSATVELKEAVVIKAPTKNIEAKQPETGGAIDEKNSKSNTAKYIIQVGVFAEESNVKRLQAKIGLAGLSSYTTEVISAQGKMHRLRVGSFVTREAAATALKKLQADGVSGMVMTDD